MENTPRYVTQISADWLKRVTKGINLKAGKGIKIEAEGDGFRIELDPEVFKQWLWTCTYRDMIATPVGSLYARPGKTLAELPNILVDPYVAS